MNNLRWLQILVLFIIVFALQLTVVNWLKFFDIGPDLVVIFIVTIAIKCGPGVGCFWGFLAGFTQDVYGPVEWLGANSIAFLVLGFVVGQLEERFLALNLPAKIGVLGLGFFVCDLIYYGITCASREVMTMMLVSKSLPECLYTMLIGGIFFYLDLGKKKKRHV